MQLICLDEQHFPQIREKNGVYVDKTRIMYDVFKDGKYFFISRPRRFGKSLLCSTLAALFAGKKDLFKGLWIEQSDWEWQAYPVIHLDMTAAASPTYSVEQVQEGVMLVLADIAQKHGIADIQTNVVELYFGQLIQKLCEKYGQRVVVIVDEYDKPLLDVFNHPERYAAIHGFLSGMYGQLKKSSEYVRFVLLTGVFKFAKTSVFSGLNNIKDLTFDPKAAELLGYTEHEIKDNFGSHLEALTEGYKKTAAEMFEILRKKYNGYTFGVDNKARSIVGSVYNPFAMNYVFNEQQLLDRWFISATPTVLLKKLKQDNFAPLEPENLVTFFPSLDASSSPENIETLHMLYYAGYLALKDYNADSNFITLDFPNHEVARAMADHLLPLVTEKPGNALMRLADRLRVSLVENDMVAFKDLLNQALS
jgi:hypothetical protein